MKKETWKPIKGLEEYASISNLGRVKAHARSVKTKSGALMWKEERILSPNWHGSKRLYVQVMIDYKKHHLFPHRLVAEHFVKKPTKNHNIVSFKNNNPEDCVVTNIQWVKFDEQTRIKYKERKQLTNDW